MKLKKALVGLAMTSLVAAPIAAQAATAEARVGSEVDGENLSGGGLALTVLALLAAGVGVYAIFSGGNDDPVSP